MHAKVWNRTLCKTIRNILSHGCDSALNTIPTGISEQMLFNAKAILLKRPTLEEISKISETLYTRLKRIYKFVLDHFAGSLTLKRILSMRRQTERAPVMVTPTGNRMIRVRN